MVSNRAILSPVDERRASIQAIHRPIALVDSVGSFADVHGSRPGGENDSGPSNESDDSPTPDFTLERRWTKQSLQRQLTQRKYARYQEHRLIDGRDDTSSIDSGTSTPRQGTTRLTRLFARKKIRPTREQDVVIDVLYENQRGVFTFGVPHFSSNSLLNFDPKPWTNAHRRSSPVNITNAQVPDPEWDWAWDSWYVDMSRDVDEQGWEYSFWFQDGAARHGNHPWFHSFVRRRRWLRKRVRHKLVCGKETHVAKAVGEQVTSRAPDSPDNVINLIKAIRSCSLDREKLVMIQTFVSDGSRDLEDLVKEMHHILALLMFQESRKYLLDILVAARSRCQADSVTQHGHSPRFQDLDSAIEAAQRQVHKLEYWSDVKAMYALDLQMGGTRQSAEQDTDWVHVDKADLDSEEHLKSSTQGISENATQASLDANDKHTTDTV